MYSVVVTEHRNSVFWVKSNKQVGCVWFVLGFFGVGFCFVLLF